MVLGNGYLCRFIIAREEEMKAVNQKQEVYSQGNFLCNCYLSLLLSTEKEVFRWKNRSLNILSNTVA